MTENRDSRTRAQWREAFEQQVAHARKMRRENDVLRADLTSTIEDAVRWKRRAEKAEAERDRYHEWWTAETNRSHKAEAELAEVMAQQPFRVAEANRVRAEKAEAELADAEQRGAVAALREAADEIPAQVAIARETRLRIRDWLRARADRVERGAGA